MSCREAVARWSAGARVGRRVVVGGVAVVASAAPRSFRVESSQRAHTVALTRTRTAQRTENDDDDDDVPLFPSPTSSLAPCHPHQMLQSRDSLLPPNSSMDPTSASSSSTLGKSQPSPHLTPTHADPGAGHRWNDAVITPLVKGTIDTLMASGVKRENIVVETVPGSYELPMACAR